MVKKDTANGGAASLLEAAKTLNDANKKGLTASSVVTAIDLEQFLIDTTADIQPPAYQLEIDGIGVIPPGITAVCGRAKQGKTQLLNVIVATLLSGRAFGTMRPRGRVSEIVWIDTEQDRWEVTNNAKRLLRAAGLDEKTDLKKIGLYIYALRPLDVEERCNVVTAALQAHTPQMLIIDGVRDLLRDFNDVAESNDVMQLLMSATSDNETLSIISVLHLNDGTEKMRGHLGTELFNKCNTRFDCTKENGVFTIKHISRQRECAPFRFCIDENGNYAPSDAVEAAGVINDTDALALCFDGGDKECGVQFSELVRRYKKFAGLSSQDKARAILKEKINHGLIRKSQTDRLFYLA